MKTFKQFLTEAKETTSKYKKGEFGYWWTVIEGHEDIEGRVYGGRIDCHNEYITSLKGCPKEVEGDFHCYKNELASLEYAPQKVEGSFDCSYNNLTSLEYAPEKVGGSFICSDNKLTSLKGCPKEVGGNFDCGANEKEFIDNEVKSLCKVKKLIIV